MIPGDIDLTENLDFRNIRKSKENSNNKIPWQTPTDQNNHSDNFVQLDRRNLYPTSLYNNLYNSMQLNIFNESNSYLVSNYSSIYSSINYNSSSTTVEYANFKYNIIYDLNNEYNVDDYSSVFKSKPRFTKEKRIPWDDFRYSSFIDDLYKLHKSDQKEFWGNPKDHFKEPDDSYYVFLKIQDKRNNIKQGDELSIMKNNISYLKDMNRDLLESYIAALNDNIDMSYLLNMGHIRINDIE